MKSYTNTILGICTLFGALSLSSGCDEMESEMEDRSIAINDAEFAEPEIEINAEKALAIQNSLDCDGVPCMELAIEAGGHMFNLDELGLAKTQANLDLDLVDDIDPQAASCPQGAAAFTKKTYRGTSITSLSYANAQCAAAFGSGWRQLRFHDNPSGWYAKGAWSHQPPANVKAWVDIANQPAECWSSPTGKGLTYVSHVDNGCTTSGCYGSGHVCNAYTGDTPCTYYRPIACYNPTLAPPQ